MAKLTLLDVTSGLAAATLLNANNVLLEAALENTISRDGTSPNHMTGNIDMNGFNLLNQGNPIAVTGFFWQGAWLTSTLYEVGDVIENGGASYFCLVEHTSGTFSTDLAAVKWELVAGATSGLPSQGGNAGKYLTTDGSSVSWEDGATVYLPLAGGTLTGGLIGTTANFSSTVTIVSGSITGITDLAVADGGTGSSTLDANAVLLGDGTDPLQTVSPGTSGNVLTSNGTTWQSSPSSAGGGSPTQQVFLSSGTWTRPTDCTKIFVRVQGGGGTGDTASGSTASGGGGAGGYSEVVLDVTAISSVVATIGTTGVASTFGSYATGGGGASGSGILGGAGGVGSVGDMNQRGQPGGTGVATIGGHGGSGFVGGGGAGRSGAAGQVGAANSGAGGAGGGTNGNFGGAGGTGIIIVNEYYD